MTSNYVVVETKEQFQDVLGADLNRVSVLNFRAEWAEPCKTMDAVARELAQRHSKLLFLQIEAEDLAEISETFDVESVPHFVVLRGHTLLDQVSGANASQLTQIVEKHAYTKPATQPLSTTNQAPQKAAARPSNGEKEDLYPQEPAPPNETEEQLVERCHRIMNSAPIVLFMKGNPDTPRCGFSNQTISILKKENKPFKTFDILQDESVRQKLKVINEWPTFPQLIINGEFVGGLDVLKEMISSGEFSELTADIK